MKKLPLVAFVATVLLFGTHKASAQTDQPYANGPVWNLSFIKTKPGYFSTYMKNLSEGWNKLMKQAKQDGLITDYKVISAPAASKDDWDLLLMIQVKNYAAIDGIEEKIDKLAEKLFGSEDQQQKAAVSRNDIREPVGEKIAQELIFK
jgi:hypothetical protein